jgi:hypothetical protein
MAELEPGGWPLEQWRTLAKVYPDSFAGLSNTSWYLLQANQLHRGRALCACGAVPQDPLRLYPLVHLVRIQIAANQPQLAPPGPGTVLRGDDADETGVDVLVAQGSMPRRAAAAADPCQRCPAAHEAAQRMRCGLLARSSVIAAGIREAHRRRRWSTSRCSSACSTPAYGAVRPATARAAGHRRRAAADAAGAR